MKRGTCVVLALLFALTLCGIENKKNLVLLTSADNPPYEFMKSGEIIGFDIDLAKIISEKLNKKLIIKDMPFSAVIPALISGQGDFALAAISPTEARRVNVDFSIPYQENMSAIVLANKNEFSNMSPKAVFPLVLLEGKTIGVQIGTHHESDIRAAEISDLEIKRYDHIGAMVAEISKAANGYGKLYGLIIGTAEAKSMVNKNPKLGMFALKFSDSFSAAFPKNSPIREEVNKIINELKATGKLEVLEIKWDINR